MSLRDLMISDLATIHADTSQFGAAEAVTYTRHDGTTVSTRMVISRTGTTQPIATPQGLFEIPRAFGYLLVSAVSSTDLADTITDAAGVVWNIDAIGTENAAVRELLLKRSDRTALIAPGQQERR